MERGEVYEVKPHTHRTRCWVAVVVVVLLLIILAIVLGVTLSRRRDSDSEFKQTFMERCRKFKGYDCQRIWDAFQQGHVNRDPCEVPPQAYDSLIEAAPWNFACSRMMFWSKTKDVVLRFTEEKDCFKTVEQTPLGFVLNNMNWCGKNGSNETVTTGCPGWSTCENNPVRSFWRRVSAAFGDAACGNVTAMLNGSIVTPFDSNSIFASIEVKKFKSPRVKNLNVVLVIQKNFVTDCSNESLRNLMAGLDKGIGYSCVAVPQSQIEKCGSNPEKPCAACW